MRWSENLKSKCFFCAHIVMEIMWCRISSFFSELLNFPKTWTFMVPRSTVSLQNSCFKRAKLILLRLVPTNKAVAWCKDALRRVWAPKKLLLLKLSSTDLQVWSKTLMATTWSKTCWRFKTMSLIKRFSASSPLISFVLANWSSLQMWLRSAWRSSQVLRKLLAS